MDQHTPRHELDQAPVRLARPLPRKAQVTLVVFGAALLFAGFFAGPAVLHILGVSAPPTTNAAAPAQGDAFKITDRQWAALKITPVTDQVFQNAAETDGKIAIDDDLVTPVLSPYTGRVTRLMAHAGDVVARGAPLFAVQATELAQAQNDLITAVAGLKTAKAQLNLATTNERRQHDLYAAQGAALKDWQQAQVDLATAQGGMNSASIALAAVRSRLRILGKSDAQIDQIENAPDFLNLDADTVVTAPIAGTVEQRQIGLGQNIVSASSGASTPVFMIADLSKVWLIGNAREESAPFLRVGDPVEVHVLAYPNRVFKARLAFVASSLDPNTHRLPVRAEVENPNGELKPEMFASFRIITGTDGSFPAVPDAAVVYEGDTAHVWVANAKAKTLEVRQIKPGRDRSGIVEVRDGLKAGEEVVTAGTVFIDRAIAGE